MHCFLAIRFAQQPGWIYVQGETRRAENPFGSPDIIDSSPLLITRSERHKSVGSRRVDIVTVRCGDRLSVVDRLESPSAEPLRTTN